MSPTKSQEKAQVLPTHVENGILRAQEDVKAGRVITLAEFKEKRAGGK